MRKNAAVRAARERAARLAERRQREEAHFADVASALATITEMVANLELAVEMANAQLVTASHDLTRAVTSLSELGYRAVDIAGVVGVTAPELRPNVALSLRITRSRSRRPKTSIDPVLDPPEGAADDLPVEAAPEPALPPPPALSPPR